jgi:uncharacterized protein YuzE
MRLRIDRAADALYLRLDESKILETEEVSPGILLDYDLKKQVVGIEILGLSKRVPGFDPEHLEVETV